MDWLQQVTDSLAARAATDAAALTLSDQDRETILDLARIASHTSGDRRNAPLLCYVLGLLDGKGLGLREAATVVGQAGE